MEPLEILSCGACAAPVPMGEGDVASCLHCGAETPLPAAHIATRDARRETEALRQRAAAAMERYGRPPTRAARLLVDAFDQPPLVWVLGYLFPVVVFVPMVMSDLARKLGGRPWSKAAAIVDALAFILFALAPRLIAISTSRELSSRAHLLATFALAPPATAGGPGRCRRCGAPVRVEAGAMLARCGYCGSDNAAHVPAELLAVAGRVRTAAEARFVEAVAAFEREAREIEAETRRWLRGTGLRVIIAFCGFSTAAVIANKHARHGLLPWIGNVAGLLAVLAIVSLFFGGGPGPERRKPMGKGRYPALSFALALVCIAAYGSCVKAR